MKRAFPPSSTIHDHSRAVRFLPSLIPAASPRAKTLGCTAQQLPGLGMKQNRPEMGRQEEEMEGEKKEGREREGERKMWLQDQTRFQMLWWHSAVFGRGAENGPAFLDGSRLIRAAGVLRCRHPGRGSLEWEPGPVRFSMPGPGQPRNAPSIVPSRRALKPVARCSALPCPALLYSILPCPASSSIRIVQIPLAHSPVDLSRPKLTLFASNPV